MEGPAPWWLLKRVQFSRWYWDICCSVGLYFGGTRLWNLAAKPHLGESAETHSSGAQKAQGALIGPRVKEDYSCAGFGTRACPHGSRDDRPYRPRSVQRGGEATSHRQATRWQSQGRLWASGSRPEKWLPLMKQLLHATRSLLETLQLSPHSCAVPENLLTPTTWDLAQDTFSIWNVLLLLQYPFPYDPEQWKSPPRSIYQQAEGSHCSVYIMNILQSSGSVHFLG